MRAIWFLLFLIASPVAADPFSLDGLTPAKLPAKWKVPKDAPSEVLAVFSPQRGDRIDCLAFRSDGRLVALSGPDQILRIMDLENMRAYTPMKQPHPVVSLAFSPDGKFIAVGDAEGNLRLVGTVGGLFLKGSIVAHKDVPIWKLEFSPDGKRLYTAARDKSAAIWDLSKSKPQKVAALEGHEMEVRSLSLSIDGNLIATAGNHDRTIRLWDVASEMPKAAGNLKLTERVVSVAFSPDAKSLAVGGAKGVPAIYTRDGQRLSKSASLTTNGHAATSIGYSPDGSRIVGISGLSSTEDRVLVWNTKGEVEHEFKYGLHLHAAAFAPDGMHLAVITETEAMIIRLPRKN